MRYIQFVIFLLHLDSFTFRIVEHLWCLSQVTLSSRNGLIMFICFINLHYKLIVMPLSFLHDPPQHHLKRSSVPPLYLPLFWWRIYKFIKSLGRTTTTGPMTFHTIMMIKITFTFWRTIWRTHIVLPFIITIMMTIIIQSLYTLIHTFNHLSSFRLIIHCYHIHTIEWSKSIGRSLNISCTATTFSSRNGANSMGRISWLFIRNILFLPLVIIMVHWDSNSMSYPNKAC